MPVSPYQFLGAYTRGRMGVLLFAMALGICASALDQVVPLGLKLLLDQLSTGRTLQSTLLILLPMAAAVLISAVMLYWQRFLIISRSRDVEMEIRNALFAALQNQSKNFFDHHPVGDLMSRVTNDVDRVREMLGPGILHLTRMGFGFLYAGIALFWISPRLAVVGLGSSLLLPLISLRFRKSLHQAFKKTSERLASMSVLVQEVLGGIPVIKSLGRESYFNQRFQDSSAELRQESLRVARHTSLVWPVINLVSGASLCVSIYYGAYLTSQGEMTVGSLAASILFLVRVQFPLVGLGWVATMVQRGFTGLERIVDLQNQLQMPSPEPLVPRQRFKHIVMKQLNFSYQTKTGSPVPVLYNIQLELYPGKQIGIVGETGSGKTTLLHVLAGIEAPPPGSLWLDGQAWEDLHPGAYSSLFALAPQDGFLFSESIRDNIELGAVAHSAVSLPAAVRAASLESDLRGFPDGLETLLGEKGVNLSGGQKQRVGLARALRASTPVLLLDDTLSAVDHHTEERIVSYLRSRTGIHSSVIVSHRYTAVAHCDEILVLDQGRIVERGAHAELLALGGLYARTWEKQQSHDAT